MEIVVTRLAMLSMHTSPLARLGTGDGGGMNVYVRETADALAGLGVEVDVYTLSSSLTRADLDMSNQPTTSDGVVHLRSGVRVHYVQTGTRDSTRTGLLDVVDRFAEEVRNDIDSRGGADVIHSHYWLSGIAGHALKHALDIPLVSTFHTFGRIKSDAGIVGDVPARGEYENEVMNCSDAIVVSSWIEAQEVQRFYDIRTESASRNDFDSPLVCAGKASQRLRVVPPGVNHQLFLPGNPAAARKLLDLPPSSPIILFAGRIQRLKGLHWAIDIVAGLRETHPDILLVVVGGPSGADGEQTLAYIRQRVQEEALADNVIFCGPQTPQTLGTYYQAADVCLIPSYSESFGLVALEAAACGLPVVASAVGGLQFAVDNGRTGFLVPRGDTKGFMREIRHLLNVPSEAQKMGDEAIQWARQFTWARSAQHLACIYHQLPRRLLVRCA